jgi:lipopolysaccharide biosynthesis glycosyltransferase
LEGSSEPVIRIFTSINSNYVDKAAALWSSVKSESFELEFNTFLVEPLLTHQESDALKNEIEKSSYPGKVFTTYDLPEDWSFILRNKSIVESCTAIKASAAKFLLDEHTKLVIYFDPDILCYSDISGLIRELQTNSVSLTPHLLEPPVKEDGIRANEIEGSLKFGIFNLGFFAFTNNLESKEVLDWWNSRLIKYCETKPESGIFTDQKWFDMSPAYFPQISALRNPGYNVAPWNIENRILRFSDGIYYCNEKPLVFFHFSSYDKPDLFNMLKHFDKSGLSLDLLKGYESLLSKKSQLKDEIISMVPLRAKESGGTKPRTQELIKLLLFRIVSLVKKVLPNWLKSFCCR